MSKWLLLLLAVAALAGVVVLERAEPKLIAAAMTGTAPATAPAPSPHVATSSTAISPPVPATLQTAPLVSEPAVVPTVVEVPAVQTASQTPSTAAPIAAVEAPEAEDPIAALAVTPRVDPRWVGLSLSQFLDRASGDLVRLSPESVTHLGIAAALGLRDDHLDSLTAEAEVEYYDTIQAIVNHLATVDLDRESPDVRLNAEIYGTWLRNQLPGRAFVDNTTYVSSYMDSYPTYVEWFMTSLHPLETRDNVADYLARLSEIPARFRELQARLAASERVNAVPPRFMLEQAVEQIRKTGSTPARESGFYLALRGALDEAGSIDPDSAFIEQAALMLEQEILPAYLELAEHVSGMALRADSDAGVWKQTRGAAYYNDCLHSQTTTTFTADEIYDLGVAEVERIEAQIRAAATAMGLDSGLTIPEVFDRAAEISGTSLGEDTIARCQKILDDAGARITSVFLRLPTRGLVVVDGGEYAYFSAGTLDGSRPGQFFAPTLMPQEIYSLPTLTYHEGVPGHGFQAAYEQEANIPPYIAGIGFTAYAEGWALYAERLMWEQGAYDEDPLGNLGRLQDELFRAVRLVVDPAIHARRWTYEQAVAYMLEHTGFKEAYVRQQVERYIVTPGQAVTYKIGMLKILALRERAKDALGEAFQLSLFHDAVIGRGSLPLDLLERRVDEYIEATLGASTVGPGA